MELQKVQPVNFSGAQMYQIFNHSRPETGSQPSHFSVVELLRVKHGFTQNFRPNLEHFYLLEGSAMLRTFTQGGGKRSVCFECNMLPHNYAYLSRQSHEEYEFETEPDTILIGCSYGQNMMRFQEGIQTETLFSRSIHPLRAECVQVVEAGEKPIRLLPVFHKFSRHIAIAGIMPAGTAQFKLADASSHEQTPETHQANLGSGGRLTLLPYTAYAATLAPHTRIFVFSSAHYLDQQKWTENYPLLS